MTLGGNITADILNQEYEIVTVPSGNTYTITSSVAANASDSGNGGSATDAAYQINVGTDSAVPLNGWGAGSWGESTWSSGGTSTVSLRTWTQANFGEDLIFGPKDGQLFRSFVFLLQPLNHFHHLALNQLQQNLVS